MVCPHEADFTCPVRCYQKCERLDLVLFRYCRRPASLYNDNHSHPNGRTIMIYKIDAATRELEECVRLGKNPASPDLLYTYLDLYKERLSQVGVEVSQAYLTRIIDLLIETICDPLVPYEWRALCLDNIHKPLFDLSNLPKTENNRTILRNKTYEIGVLTRHLFKYGGV